MSIDTNIYISIYIYIFFFYFAGDTYFKRNSDHCHFKRCSTQFILHTSVNLNLNYPPQLFSQGGGFMDMFGMMGEMMGNMVSDLFQSFSNK